MRRMKEVESKCNPLAGIAPRLSKSAAACLLMSMSGVSLAAPAEVTELIVRFNYERADVARPETLARSINTAHLSPQLQKRLAYPRSAYPLVRPLGKTSVVRKHGPAPTRIKSARNRLEEYVVLKYPTRKALEMAKDGFEKDPRVLSVEENAPLFLSAVPTDPYFPKASRDVDYQWGLHTMNIPAAWDYTHGHAYIGMVDTGIMTRHPDLQHSFRAHLSYDFGHHDGSVDERASNVREGNEKNIDDVPFGTPPARVGHGTHVAGIMAATANNGIGGAGICWDCSLMVGKAAKIAQRPGMGSDLSVEPTLAAAAITAAADTGVQVLNMSFGSVGGSCSSSKALCDAIAYANEMDVMMIASAGNHNGKGTEYPASDLRVIAVTALDHSGFLPSWATRDGGVAFGAPGVHVFSTFYSGVEYTPANTDSEFHCSDRFSGPSGYGPCSGTSMAAPHVSGATALIRSVNPLLKGWQVTNLLRQHADKWRYSHSEIGAGIPNVAESVKEAMGTAGGRTLVNRLTPLFSLYSAAGEDHFYTTVPQMAMAAVYGSLQPQLPGGHINWTSEGGSNVPGYADFPRRTNLESRAPKAAVYVFTTFRNPLHPNRKLAPLYRLSRLKPTAYNRLHVDHVYVADQAAVAGYTRVGYKLDGIEGYIYPYNEPRPAGTVRLYTKYNVTRDDNALFPESMAAEMARQGYTRNSRKAWIGYVYPNIDTDGDGLIDGFERIIRTNRYNPDSDRDGVSDGREVNDLLTDPLRS